MMQSVGSRHLHDVFVDANGVVDLVVIDVVGVVFVVMPSINVVDVQMI